MKVEPSKHDRDLRPVSLQSEWSEVKTFEKNSRKVSTGQVSEQNVNQLILLNDKIFFIYFCRSFWTDPLLDKFESLKLIILGLNNSCHKISIIETSDVMVQKRGRGRPKKECTTQQRILEIKRINKKSAKIYRKNKKLQEKQLKQQ